MVLCSRRPTETTSPDQGRPSGATAGTTGDAPAGLDDILLELAPFPLGKSTPDAEPLIVLERVLQALAAHIAAHTDLLGVARGAALLGEERLRIGLSAQGAFLPRQFILDGVDQLDVHDQL